MSDSLSQQIPLPGPSDVGPPLSEKGKALRLAIIPLSDIKVLPGRVFGVPAAEARQDITIPKNNKLCSVLRPQTGSHEPSATGLTQDELIQLEHSLRRAAFTTNDRLFLGLHSNPTVEICKGNFAPLYEPSRSLESALRSGAGKGGIYQLMQFPVARLNGATLPAGSTIRFADPTRWFRKGMESRLFTTSVKGSNKFYAWDAHVPVGNHPHNYYHINQKGMHAVFGHANHANLGGAQLVQAKQLRYLKIGGRIFLVVGIVVDTAQLGSAAVESIEQGTPRPIAAQAVRTTGSWAMAWAGAKAGILIGSAAGVETGPGLALTAIGGGIIFGIAGYMGSDWIADFIYED